MSEITPVGESVVQTFEEWALECWAKAHHFGRTAVEWAWKCGRAFTRLKAELGHGNWIPWLEEHGIAATTAKRWMKLSQIDQIGRFDTIEAALKSLNPAHVSRNTGEAHWDTPPEILEAARETMGGIDLDPATNEQGQERVRAERYFTAEDDGLAEHRVWSGRVWMNPPYDAKLVAAFVDRLLDSPNVEQAITLVNNATETKWGQRLLREASVVCFPSGRVKFLDADGVPGAPLQGQMIAGIRVDVGRFKDAFGQIGVVRC